MKGIRILSSTPHVLRRVVATQMARGGHTFQGASGVGSDLHRGAWGSDGKMSPSMANQHMAIWPPGVNGGLFCSLKNPTCIVVAAGSVVLLVVKIALLGDSCEQMVQKLKVNILLQLLNHLILKAFKFGISNLFRNIVYMSC